VRGSRSARRRSAPTCTTRRAAELPGARAPDGGRGRSERERSGQQQAARPRHRRLHVAGV